MPYDINQDYDVKLKNNLEKRLSRSALSHEVVNADTDADLVNETLWQIICEMEQRISALEKGVKVKP